MTDLLTGQYEGAFYVVCFTSAEGWARDVSEDIAKELTSGSRRGGPRESELLHLIADEADRGVLVTAEWMTPGKFMGEPPKAG